MDVKQIKITEYSHGSGCKTSPAVIDESLLLTNTNNKAMIIIQ